MQWFFEQLCRCLTFQYSFCLSFWDILSYFSYATYLIHWFFKMLKFYFICLWIDSMLTPFFPLLNLLVTLIFLTSFIFLFLFDDEERTKSLNGRYYYNEQYFSLQSPNSSFIIIIIKIRWKWNAKLQTILVVTGAGSLHCRF